MTVESDNGCMTKMICHQYIRSTKVSDSIPDVVTASIGGITNANGQPDGTSNVSDICDKYQGLLTRVLQWGSVRILFFLFGQGH